MAQIDTGSADSLVTRTYSTDLPKVGRSTIRGAFRQMRTQKVRLPSLRWAGKLRSGIVARVRPDFQEDLPFKAGITLGNSVLLARPLYVDFERMRIGPGRPKGYRPVLSAPLEMIKGLPFFHLSIGRRRLGTVFDLGAGISVLNQRIHFPNQGRVLSERGEDTTRESRRFTLYRGPDVSLDRHRFGRAEYTTLNLQEIESRLGSQIDFVFGANMLLKFGGIWKLDARLKHVEWG